MNRTKTRRCRLLAVGCLGVSLAACSASSPTGGTGGPGDGTSSSGSSGASSSGGSSGGSASGGTTSGGSGSSGGTGPSGSGGGAASDDAATDDASSSGAAGDAAGAHDASSGAHDGGASDAGSSGAAHDAGSSGALPYMVGIKTNSTPTGPAKVEAWLDRPLDIAGTTITTTSYIGSGTPYTTASGAHPLLECSFPLLSIFGESNNLNDMAQAASGAYDATYEAMAQALASWANPLLSVRIGWEFNGNWYKWSNGAGHQRHVCQLRRRLQARRGAREEAQPARPHPVEHRVGAARPDALLARRVRRQRPTPAASTSSRWTSTKRTFRNTTTAASSRRGRSRRAA